MAGPIGSGVGPRHPVVPNNVAPPPGGDTPLPPGVKLAPDGKTLLSATGKPLIGADGKPVVLQPGQTLSPTGQIVAQTPVGGAAPVAGAGAVKRAVEGDKVEAAESFSLTTLSEKPELPPDVDAIPNSNTAGDFKAFSAFIEMSTEQLAKPGQLKEIWARGLELRNNPEQSVVMPHVDGPEGVALGNAIGDNLDETAKQIRDGLPENLQGAWDDLVTQIKDSPVGKDPKLAMCLLEACADLTIMMCFRMNDSAARKMKSFYASVLGVMAKFDTAKQNEISAYQGQIATKLESGKRAQEAADRNKFWNCLLAIGLIIVAIVCLVLSIFTFGAAAAGSVAAIMAAIAVVAAVVMTVCVIIQNLPAILDACGADEAAAAMRKALAGPFGKVLMVLMIVAAVCMLVCGIGGAIAAAATTAVEVPAAGTQVSLSVGSTTVNGTVGTATTVGASTVTPIMQGTTQVATITTQAGVSTVSAVSGTASTGAAVTNGACTGMSFATSTTNVFGGAMTATVPVSGGVANFGSASIATAGSSSISAAQGAAGVAGGGMSVARGCIQMDMAQLELATAMLSADVQELQTQMARVKSEMDLNQIYKGDWQDSINAVEEFLNKIFQQAVTALQAQAEADQAVNSTFR